MPAVRICQLLTVTLLKLLWGIMLGTGEIINTHIVGQVDVPACSIRSDERGGLAPSLIPTVCVDHLRAGLALQATGEDAVGLAA